MLGRGGEGVVHLVRDRAQGDELRGLKVFELPAGRPDLFGLIKSEFSLLARVEHPNLPRAYDVGAEGSTAWLSLEYVAGADLVSACARLDRRAVLSLCDQVLEALGFIHSLGYAHGDVKPQNVRVDPGPPARAVLLDFGLVESILPGRQGTARGGTPAYMAPETAAGMPADPRSDLYSFGVSIFQLLTGRLPFSADSAAALARMHATAPAPALSAFASGLSPALDAFCAKLLEKEPRNRFHSAAAALASLEAATGVRATRGPGAGVEYLLDSVFVGRDRALADIDRALAPSFAPRGCPSFCAVVGPEGMGKTRLLKEYAVSARVRGVRVIEARGGSGMLEGLLKALALAMENEPGDHSPALSKPADLRTALERACSSAPVLAVVDDLHRAAAAEVAALASAFDGSNGRFAALAGFRPGFESRDAGEAAAAWIKPADTIAPSGFGEAETGEWVYRALPGAKLTKRYRSDFAVWSGGNPGLLRTLLLGAAARGWFSRGESGWEFSPPAGELAVPAGDEGVQARLRHLDPAEAAALSALALCRAPIPCAMLCCAPGLDEGLAPAALRGLARKGWLAAYADGAETWVPGSSVRRAIAIRTDPAIRREIHEALARAMEAAWKNCADPERLRRIAEHWVGACEPEKAFWACFHAGDALHHSGFVKASEAVFRAGVRAARTQSRSDLPYSDLRRNLGVAWSHRGMNLRAARMYETLLREPLPAFNEANIHHLAGVTKSALGRHDEALAHYDKAIALLQGTEHRLPLGCIHVNRVQLLNSLGRFDEVVGSESVACFFGPENGDGKAELLHAVSRAFMAKGDAGSAMSSARNAVRALAGAKGFNRSATKIFRLMAEACVFAGDFKRAEKWLRWAGHEKVVGSNPHSRAFSEHLLARVRFEAGAPDEAHRLLDAALSGLGRENAGANMSWARSSMADFLRNEGWYGDAAGKNGPSRTRDHRDALAECAILSRAGASVEAYALLDRVEARGFAWAPDRAEALFTRAALAIDRRDADGAADCADRIATGFKGMTGMRPRLRLLEAYVALERGDASLAMQKARSALDEFESSGRSGFRGACELALGQAALLSGDFAEAARLGRAAALSLAKAGRGIAAWEAELLRARGMERAGWTRGAACAYRRAAWLAEREMAALLPRLRPLFASRPQSGAALALGQAHASEDRARRMASRVSGALAAAGGEWGDAVAAMLERVARLSGSDAAVFEPRWEGAFPAVVVAGKADDRDRAWSFDAAKGSQRPGLLTLRRKAWRGPVPPVVLRCMDVIAASVHVGLESSVRAAAEDRFERTRLTLEQRLTELETALDTARDTIARGLTSSVIPGEFGGMTGVSSAMRKLFGLIERFAPGSATVLVTGESGTGKELVAKALHDMSGRIEGPYFAVNCAAVAESLLETELFGHEKGAFTGAEDTRPGLFELASAGTLVLDEISETSPRMQAQLLRVLEERKTRRVGGFEEIRVNARIVALTNKPLEKEVEAGRFRKDLFYRLDQARIEVPPLRRRREDIPLLAARFVREFEGGRGGEPMSGQVAAVLMRHRWPGNVRELKNRVQNALIMAGGRPLEPGDFADLLRPKLTRTALTDGIVAQLRKAAAKAGFPLSQRHEDLFRLLASGGQISRREYAEIAGVSGRTANRDLDAFVGMGMLARSGTGRATRYALGVSTRGEQ